MYFSPTYSPLFQKVSKKMHFLLTKTIPVFFVPVTFPKSLVNKTVLFWSTDFHLLTNRFLTTQNHWKPFKTIKRKKADFSALSKLLKNVEKGWKSARLERVTGSNHCPRPIFQRFANFSSTFCAYSVAKYILKPIFNTLNK